MQTPQRRLKIFTLLMFFLIFSCSSGDKRDSVISKTFKGTRMLPDAVNRIYINKISSENVSSAVKDVFEYSLRKCINLNQKLDLVESPEKSDLIVKILLTGYSSVPVKFNSSGIAEETKLRLDSFVWITAAATGEDRVKNKKVESEYLYSGIKPPVMSEFKAITFLSDLLAERIVSVMSTGWYQDKYQQP